LGVGGQPLADGGLSNIQSARGLASYGGCGGVVIYVLIPILIGYRVGRIIGRYDIACANT